MNIIFGKENLDDIDQRYVVLELDTICQLGQSPITAYALVDQTSIADLNNLDNLKDLHNKLIKNYKLRNWSFCEQALDHLKGCWNSNLDSFYDIFKERIDDLKHSTLPEDWDGVIQKP